MRAKTVLTSPHLHFLRSRSANQSPLSASIESVLTIDAVMTTMTVALGAAIAVPRTAGVRRTRVTAAARAFPTSRIAPRVAISSRRRDASSVRLQASDNPGQAPSLSVNDENAEEPALSPRPKPTKKPDEPVPNPPLRVAAFLAGAGFLESSYLAVEKLTGGEVTCPLTGCQTALNSGYSELFGVPLSAYGATAYFGVAALTWWGAGMAGNEEEKDAYQRARVLTFLSTAGLAGVSSYLLYLLAVPLGGAECVYCLTSAAISFSLFAIGLSGVSGRDFGKAAPAAFSVYIVTVLSLSVLLTDDSSQANINSLKLPYAAPVIEAQSTSYSRDLAAHLKSVGAKMYGGVLVLALRGSEGVFRRGCRHSLRGVLPQRVGEGHAGGGGVLRGGYPGISDVDFGGRTEVRRGEDAR